MNDRLSSDTYDANGNTKVSSGGSYDYDFENRLITHTSPVTSGFVYDGDGNRVAKTVNGLTTNYLVDTNNHTGYAQVVEELQGGVVTKQFTFGHDLISQRIVGGSLSFYQYDGHGSVRLLSDATAAITDTYDYDAFGNLISRSGTTPNDYLYSGEQFDANLGFYYLRARYMNASSGRFWTIDAFEGDLADPVSLHKYLYVGANPVNYIDPSGKASQTDQFIVFAMMATLVTMSALVLVNTLPKIKVEVETYELPRVIPLPPPLPAPSPEPTPTPRLPPHPKPDEDNRRDHEGRIQVQGFDIVGMSGAVRDTISWNWAQGTPLSLTDGLTGLHSLKERLNRSQLRLREEAFQRAEKYMYVAAAAGGTGTVKRSFQNRNLRESERSARVDIVVDRGWAFGPF